MNEEASFEPASAGDDAARDLALMLRVKEGDAEAFRELVEAHQQRIVGTVSRMLGGDETEAEDVAQQVFLRIWKSAPRWEPAAKFSTWAFTIMKNLVFNETRRRSRRSTLPLETSDGEDEHQFQHPDEAAKAPDRAMLDAEHQDAIERAIAELPEIQRMALVLRRYQDVSYEEIAAILELTVPALKSVLYRARTELREKLRQYLEG
jgi:RNA polymerase sigma-70 factor, ECF subfamily